MCLSSIFLAVVTSLAATGRLEERTSVAAVTNSALPETNKRLGKAVADFILSLCKEPKNP